MINLLPPQEKKELRAARTNVLLLRYNILLICSVGFLGLATGITYVYLSTTKASAEQAIHDNNAKETAYTTTKVQAGTFRNNLATAKQILNNEVTYSKVIVGIAQLLPPGVVFNSLNLDAGTFGTQTTFALKAKSYQQALALKDAFEKSSIFTDVHFQSIATADSASDGYPISIELNATIKKEAVR